MHIAANRLSVRLINVTFAIGAPAAISASTAGRSSRSPAPGAMRPNVGNCILALDSRPSVLGPLWALRFAPRISLRRTQMLLAEDDHMIDALASDRANQSLRMSVLPQRRMEVAWVQPRAGERIKSGREQASTRLKTTMRVHFCLTSRVRLSALIRPFTQ
jgi:hypothetical protein